MNHLSFELRLREQPRIQAIIVYKELKILFTENYPLGLILASIEHSALQIDDCRDAF